jgi:capsular polysaccharide biosynthesis protein
VGTAAGYAVANRLPSEYAAHADVLYPLTEAQPTGFLRQDRVLSTQEVLMDSRTVLDPVAAQFGVKVDDLADAVQTEVVSDSEVIRVQLTDESRARARKMLTAVITQYLAVANNPQRTQLQTYLQAQLADVQDRIAAAREVKDSEGEISVLLQRQTSLQSQLDDDQLSAIAGGTPRLTVAPYVEHDRVSPNTLMAVGGGALAGLVVALVTVAVLGRRMTRP